MPSELILSSTLRHRDNLAEGEPDDCFWPGDQIPILLKLNTGMRSVRCRAGNTSEIKLSRIIG